MLSLAYLSVGNTQFLFQAEFKKELSVVIYLPHFVLISEVFLVAIVPAYLYKIDSSIVKPLILWVVNLKEQKLPN